MLRQLATSTSFQLSIHRYSINTTLYIVTVKLKAPRLVKNLLFVVPLNPWLFHKSKRPRSPLFHQRTNPLRMLGENSQSSQVTHFRLFI